MTARSSTSRTGARPSRLRPGKQRARGFYGGDLETTEDRLRRHSQLVLAFAIGMLAMGVITTFAGVFP